MNNPAFMASVGDDGSGGESSSAGSTTRPGDSTGEPPATTTATPTTAITDGPEPATTTAPATTDPGDTASTTTGVDPNDTTGPDPSSSGNIPDAVCGNGNLEGGEQCDDGQIEPAPGKCSPDCQAVIGEKRIFAFNAQIIGAFMNLGDADSACGGAASQLGLDGTFKALISDGDVRVGSVQPWDGQASPDWPLRPYTAYFNADEQLVWITLKRPLLGAGLNDDGLLMPNPIQPNVQFAVWTGMKSDWVSGENCGKWAAAQKQGLAGKPYKTDNFLDTAGLQTCETLWGLICVEQ